jgi:hypothetical protein
MCNMCTTTASNPITTPELAKRAREELAAAMVALQQAGALFAAIEKAVSVGDRDLPFLLAQIGSETTSYQSQRCNSECDYFEEASHE